MQNKNVLFAYKQPQTKPKKKKNNGGGGRSQKKIVQIFVQLKWTRFPLQ